MFHCGFEWPISERRNFEKLILENRWPSSWFSKATSKGEPWAFYINDVFIEHCLDTVNKSIKAFGIFARQLLSKNHQSFKQ
jgi:hypothetical protein